MNKVALATKYRPQIFAEVAGQQMITAILSRASAEDRIAPAYLFSGTRGVGKTTMARILAKAVNCEQAPAAEPCNQCRHCRAITAGTAVDVVEIDAASHGGVDDARRLKEEVGFAPMDSRYKVFIIDEAHMLSTAAFNALLKTLEEPPAGVTFIMATTEVRKFPATIISRCQHFIFKRLPLPELEAHLAKICDLEGLERDPAALNILARRAAGSVRDAMSILGQVMALGRDRLSAEDIRLVLGLAGLDMHVRIMEAVRAGDCAALAQTVREMLDMGLDMGFFLREFGLIWRNLFLLRQSGQAAGQLIDLPAEEIDLWRGWAEQFDLTSIHACWQMTLEAQRRVLNSLEPALALELFLFNLAMLPRLLSVEGLSERRPVTTVAPEPSRPVGAGAPPTAKTLPVKSAPLEEPATPPQQPVVPSETAQSRVKPDASPLPEEEVSPARMDEQPRTWKGFLKHHQTSAARDGRSLPAMAIQRVKKWEVRDSALHLTCHTVSQRDELARPEHLALFERLAGEYFQVDKVVLVALGGESDGPAGAARHPLVREMQRELGASLLDLTPRGPASNDNSE